jgi:iron complex outermembrane receptor protein
MLMQELPWNMHASVMYFQSGSMRWRRNGTDPLSATERFDWRLAKKFKIGDSRAELAYTVQMQNGSQEGRIIGTGTAYRYIDKLHWLSLRLDF